MANGLSLACHYYGCLSFSLSLARDGTGFIYRSAARYPPLNPYGALRDGFFNFNFENYGLIIEYADDYIGPAINSVRIAFCHIDLFALCLSDGLLIARTDERTRLILLSLSFFLLDVQPLACMRLSACSIQMGL